MQCRYLAESKIYDVLCGGEISDSGWLFNLARKQHHSEHHWLEAETRQIQSRNQFEHTVIKHCDHFLAGSVDSPSASVAQQGHGACVLRAVV